MRQLTPAMANGFEKHSRVTREGTFLAKMDKLAPRKAFCALIEPHYPKAGERRRPKELEAILRMYLPRIRCASQNCSAYA